MQVFRHQIPTVEPNNLIMNTEQLVSEIMTRSLVTVAPGDTFSQVTRIFRENAFHHIPVVTAGRSLVGIISKQDLLTVYQERGKEFDVNQINELPAESFMTSNPLTIDPEDTIGLAGDIILNNLFHSLPVVEEGMLVGIVTSMDVLEAMLRGAGSGETVLNEEPEAFFDAGNGA